MIAFENMSRVDAPEHKFVPTAQWNWKPEVAEPSGIDKSFIEASGGNSTSRQTQSHTTDHGESW